MSGGQTRIDPELVEPAGGQVRQAGEAAEQAVPGRIAAIRAAEAGQPWGNDNAGQAFAKNYLPASAELDSVQEVVAAVRQLGENIVLAATNTTNVDTESAAAVTDASADAGTTSLSF